MVKPHFVFKWLFALYRKSLLYKVLHYDWYYELLTLLMRFHIFTNMSSRTRHVFHEYVNAWYSPKSWCSADHGCADRARCSASLGIPSGHRWNQDGDPCSRCCSTGCPAIICQSVKNNVALIILNDWNIFIYCLHKTI